MDYDAVTGLGSEVKQSSTRCVPYLRPGLQIRVTPAAISLLMVALEKRKRKGEELRIRSLHPALMSGTANCGCGPRVQGWTEESGMSRSLTPSRGWGKGITRGQQGTP
jgi:hypothetical protein